MQEFGTFQETPVYLIPLEAGALRCEILSFGAIVRSLWVPDAQGRPVDVVLGFEDLAGYLVHPNYCFGAVVGPVANRIGGAAYSLNGQNWQMTVNDGPNSLHSGEAGIQWRNWQVESCREDAVTLTITHPHGLGGIPGPIRIRVPYTLTERGLILDYWAKSQRDTLCNLTNHSYFNLEGHDSGSAMDQELRLFAKSFTPTDPASIPTGAIRALAGTPMDFTRFTPIGQRIDADYDQLQWAKGYDHNWVVDPGEDRYRPFVQAKAPRSGICMTGWTDLPGVQFYTGNYLEPQTPGKAGAVYARATAWKPSSSPTPFTTTASPSPS